MAWRLSLGSPRRATGGRRRDGMAHLRRAVRPWARHLGGEAPPTPAPTLWPKGMGPRLAQAVVGALVALLVWLLEEVRQRWLGR